MKNFKPNSIICQDIKNIKDVIPENSIDLSIVHPPYSYFEDDEKFSNQLKDILAKINHVTKPGGILCIILSDDINPKNNSMNMIAAKTILHLADPNANNSDWRMQDEIIWVKSPKKEAEQMGKGILVDFEKTPFSSVYVLEKKGSNFEFVNRQERTKNSRISENKKMEILDSIWFIQPKSEREFKDRLPKELIIRLILLFSKENDLVFDPFSCDGITGIVSKVLKRYYLCLVDDDEKIILVKKRLEKYS